MNRYTGGAVLLKHGRIIGWLIKKGLVTGEFSSTSIRASYSRERQLRMHSQLEDNAEHVSLSRQIHFLSRKPVIPQAVEL